MARIITSVLTFLVTISAFSAAAYTRDGQPEDDLVEPMGMHFRKFYDKDKDGHCPPDAVTFPESSYCHFNDAPEPMSMLESLDLGDNQKITNFVQISRLKNDDAGGLKAANAEFARTYGNQRRTYQECLDYAKTHEDGTCSLKKLENMKPEEIRGLGADAYPYLLQGKLPPPSKKRIDAIYKIELTPAALLVIGQNAPPGAVFDKFLYLIRYTDSSQVVTGEERKPLNTGEEVILAPDGTFLWHNRWGRLDLM